ncbi:MAG: HNH endonuclease [Bdellovibrionales bacterium]|nr:HNH endonuclease [Bdellovibrionales bacterium]
MKFQARCSHVDPRGERCRETKFLEIHHLKPIRLGGSDRFENLTLLCSGHHQGIHI